MQQDNPTINLTAPTGWNKLDDHQLRYVFGLLAQGFPSPQVMTYCLFRWTGMQVMHKYGKGRLCKFADDEFVIMAEQVNSAIAALDRIDKLPLYHGEGNVQRLKETDAEIQACLIPDIQIGSVILLGLSSGISRVVKSY